MQLWLLHSESKSTLVQNVCASMSLCQLMDACCFAFAFECRSTQTTSCQEESHSPLWNSTSPHYLWSRWSSGAFSEQALSYWWHTPFKTFSLCLSFAVRIPLLHWDNISINLELVSSWKHTSHSALPAPHVTHVLFVHRGEFSLLTIEWVVEQKSRMLQCR